ncbi:nucleotidyl transferase AbiEii/AbiGii toxin family protein [Actinosynnema sp. CA-248983]
MENPKRYRDQLNARAKAAAKVVGGTPGDLLQRFYLSRLLARVFLRPDGWVLKGGQALLVRYPDARHSRDVDLIHTGETVSEAVQALIAAVETTDVDDGLVFRHLDTTPSADESRAVGVRFDLRIGLTAITIVSVDLVLRNRPLAGEPVLLPVRAHLDLDGMVEPPGLTVHPHARLYPLVDTVADKISAMLETRGPDGTTPSSRHRDLVDLLLIIDREPFDGRHLHRALHDEIQHRQQAGTIRSQLPDRFNAPPNWRRGFPRDAGPLPAHLRGLDAAQVMAALFVDPLLAATPPGRWEPAIRAWTSPTTS